MGHGRGKLGKTERKKNLTSGAGAKRTNFILYMSDIILLNLFDKKKKYY